MGHDMVLWRLAVGLLITRGTILDLDRFRQIRALADFYYFVPHHFFTILPRLSIIFWMALESLILSAVTSINDFFASSTLPSVLPSHPFLVSTNKPT